MNNPELYVKANQLQRYDVSSVLSEYIDTFDWSAGDLILDIGCGTGDVTANILLPKLPHDIGQVIGSDMSKDMVAHASANYASSKLKFTQLDIATKTLDLDRIIDFIGIDERRTCLDSGVFDKLFSFFCLHWVKDQKAAITNIYNLMKPLGEGLVILVADSPVYDAFEKMSKIKRWEAYMNDASEFLSPYRPSLDSSQELKFLLQEVGFEVIDCRTETRSFQFETADLLKNAVRAINPFVDRLPKELKEEYMHEFVTKMNCFIRTDISDQQYLKYSKSKQNGVTFQHDIIIAHFRKL